jgi:hypothetical protein
LGQSDVEYTILVDGGFDGEGCAGVIEFNGEIVSIEAVPPFVEPVIVERVRTPQVLESSIVIENL